MDGWCAPDLIGTNELQQMLNITSAIAGKYHVELGEEQSNVMKIGRNKENPEFTLGDMNLKYTDKCKYLGYVQNNQNNLEDHIKATKAKVENTYQTPLAIAGNKNFSNIEMQTIWELTQSCITSTIAYSSGAQEKLKMKTLTGSWTTS